MKLFAVTITGAADGVDPAALYRLSQQYPFVEWAILLSSTKAGNHPRYPSNEWLGELERIKDLDREETGMSDPRAFRLAAHLCGRTMREFMTGIREDSYSQGWCMQHGLTEDRYSRMFERTQVNFNAKREGYSPHDMTEMMKGWYETQDGALITQHNANNDWVWKAIQKDEHHVVRAHHVLHDASGGRGTSPSGWDQPIAGILNGYAGGIGPTNVSTTIRDLKEMIPNGYIWIDMESGVRDDDDQLDMAKVTYLLQEVAEGIESTYK